MQVLILGFDAFDPVVFERLSDQGRLPNLTAFAENGHYARLSVSNPPQTEVSWTSIATGVDPGGHGIFDFIHRDPGTYTPYLSLLPTRHGALGTSFVPPYRTRTIFEEATRQGYPATVLWWPATFPSRPELPVRSLPGLGTPDIQGRWGVGTLLTTDTGLNQDEFKTELAQLAPNGSARYTGILHGPVRKSRKGPEQATLELDLEIADEGPARLRIGEHSFELVEGQWSPIVELSFKMGRFMKVRALTRLILSQVGPAIKLYVLPLQVHPLHSPWRYGSPGSFVKETWREYGPFLTLGWPQDTTALDEGWITDAQFLDLCEAILATRESILFHQLERFGEGMLAVVFDSLDRVQHMFTRDRPDLVDEWYTRLDSLVGKVGKQLNDRTENPPKVLIASDHGFSRFDYAVHLNRWRIEQEYLALRVKNGGAGNLKDVDWTQSQAYAVGLNSLYLNLAGREGQGSVQVEQREALRNEIRDRLLQWQGPDGHRVVQSVAYQEDAFHGDFAAHGPDMVIGFSPGYRASSETGLGRWKGTTVEPNQKHWGADHCVYPEAVPGVLFCNERLSDFPTVSFRDIPALTLGKELDPGHAAPPPTFNEEEEDIIEERLKGLGYL